MTGWEIPVTASVLSLAGVIIAALLKRGSNKTDSCMEHSAVVTRIGKNERDITTLFATLDKLVESTANLKAAVEGMNQNARR